MIKCILIYLWIYIGIYYVIEAAADADEHVHIKLHVPRGQRKHNHPHHHHISHHKKRQLPLHYNSAPLAPREREPPQLYHETSHNYLTGISTTTTTPQHHLHHWQHAKKLPTTYLHETIGQLLEADDVYGSGSSSGGGSSEAGDTAAADTEDGEQHMQYLVDNFALFPQPSTSTTYETELRPHNSHGFAVPEETDEEDNEISGPANGSHDSELIMMEEEEAENYPRHRPYTSPTKTMKNEQQLLQQIYQQQQEQHQQQHNQFEQAADYMKTAKLRGNKYKKAEKEYHSEDDMTENMMYNSMPHTTTTTTMTTFAKGNNAKVDHSDGGGGFKALTVDDIWSQLQRQYLNKYVPQAQPSNEGGDDGGENEDISLKATTKRKRTIIRQKPIKPNSSSSSSSRQPTSSFWPAKTNNYDSNHQPQHEDSHLFHSYSASPTLSPSSSLTSSSGNTELFDDTRPFRRPYNKFNGHNTAKAHHTGESGADFHVANEDDNDDIRIQFNTDNNDDDDDISSHHHHPHRDASFEESVYQRGKKYVANTGHVAYGQSNVNNPFNYPDLYGTFSTPITATVATKVHPSTYHPKLTRASPSQSTSYSSSPGFYGDAVSPTLSHESTSYQWHTQQHNPESYQSYHSHHQQEPQQHQQQQEHHQQHLQYPTQHRFHHFQPPQSSALRLPKATITIMPSTASTAISSTFASSLSPTLSNDFTSSPGTTKSTLPTTSRYKKRKNRIKTKKNRIVVV